MPNIQKTRGIILRTYPFKESSLFCSIFTERFGRLKLIARGVRRPKSRLCGTLEPCTHSEVIFYKREYSDSYTLSDAVIIEDFPAVRTSPIKFSSCEMICEFIDKTMSLEESNQPLYNLILIFFKKISFAPEELVGLLVVLMLFRLLKFAGIEPHLKDCVKCHKVVEGQIINFSIQSGGIVCDDHFDHSVLKIEKEAIRYIIDVRKNKFPKKEGIIHLKKLKELFEAYIYYHLNGMTLNAIRFLY